MYVLSIWSGGVLNTWSLLGTCTARGGLHLARWDVWLIDSEAVATHVTTGCETWSGNLRLSNT
ncbi:hypothetical protein OHB53_11320 [Streptomyces sp. NBC_00056]|uniref:hypothetical protein n=1 Tax=Streptomyces sp. NBC_00056 TaxID=2975633 RepID=UPI00325594BB